MKNQKHHLSKHTSPTRWDRAPYSTIWRIEDQSQPMIFIQMNEDIENPFWIPMADVMVKTFDKFYSDPSFIDSCIKLYKSEVGSSKPPFKSVKFIEEE